MNAHLERNGQACAEQNQSHFQRFSIACRQKLNALKASVTRRLAAEFAGLKPELVQQAVNDADAVAAFTPYPALFLPALAEEKVLFASRWQARQQSVYERSLALAA